MFTSLPIGGIFPVLGVTNTFGDYTELNIYPMPTWAKLCDGSIVNDIDSALNGMYVPDLTSSTPVGDLTAGNILPERIVGDAVYTFGPGELQTLTNTENGITVKYFMRTR
jgi:hypothetical protein